MEAANIIEESFPISGKSLGTPRVRGPEAEGEEWVREGGREMETRRKVKETKEDRQRQRWKRERNRQEDRKRN